MFEQMAAILPEESLGEAELSYITIDEREEQFSHLRAMASGFRGEAVRKGTYVRLHVGKRLFMSDTQMEQDSNRAFVRRANGDVLIAGLGIGLVLLPLFKKEDVRSVAVIEQSQDVANLVGKYIQDPKLNVIVADIFEWKPAKGTKFDTIYFDIWSDICEDNLEEMAKLHNRFKWCLNRENPSAFMDSWQRDYLKYERQRNRSYRYW